MKHIAMASVMMSKVEGIPGGYNTAHTQVLLWRPDLSEKEMRGEAVVAAMEKKPGYSIDEILVMIAPVEAQQEVPSIDVMVNRFLCWKLPSTFNPDGGVSFDVKGRLPSTHWWPTGTNILNAEEAKQMIEHLLAK